MRLTIRHEFVDTIPEALDEGAVYISLTYATSVHRCCCGCGHEVVTPLHPRQWSLIFNGETISLTPSVGNWSFPCRSHYWIRAGRVRNARPFTKSEVTELRADEQATLVEHYESQASSAPKETAGYTEHWWTRLSRWVTEKVR